MGFFALAFFAGGLAFFAGDLAFFAFRTAFRPLDRFL